MPFTDPKKFTYARQFRHDDWLDNIDRVQAAGASGFNLRFHALEDEFESIRKVMDNLTVIAKELQDAVTIFGDAPTLRNLTVQEKIGIGTIAPVEDLHIQRSRNTPVRAVVENTSAEANAGTRFIARESPTRAIELGYINSGSGSFRDLHANTAFVAALAGASFLAFNHQGAGPITFHTDDWHERMRITRDGNVGIGTTQPQAALHVPNGAIFNGLGIGLNHPADPDLNFNTIISTRSKTESLHLVSFGGIFFYAAGGSGAQAGLKVDGTWFGSSQKMKENISELSLSEATETLMGLKPVKFAFKADDNKKPHIGFIAEEVPEIFASADKKMISPMDIIAVLTRVVQEQQQRMLSMQGELDLLKYQLIVK